MNSIKSPRSARIIPTPILVFIIGVYLYAIPASIAQLTAAGYPLWLAIALTPLTSTFALFLAFLAIGLFVYIGCIVDCLIVADIYYCSNRKKS